jgi:hypothetical protein
MHVHTCRSKTPSIVFSSTLCALAMFLLPCTTLVAQSSAASRGRFSISAGAGALSYEGLIIGFAKSFLTDSTKSYTDARVSPLFFKAEYAVTDHLGVGVNVNYSSYNANFKFDSLYSGSLALRMPSVLFRLNAHFLEDEHWDVYGGAGLGWRSFNVQYTDNRQDTPSPSFSIPIPFTFELTVGARYLITPNVGVYAELGVTRAFVQAGLTASFGGNNDEN